jgi:glucose/arabinose dehydrogenase
VVKGEIMGTITDTINFRTFSRAIRCFFGAGFLPILTLTLTISSSRAGDSIDAERIATGFDLPLYLCAPPGDTSRLFVAEQHGKIKIINLPSRTVNATPFLDISFEVGQGQGTGILGMTFDPNYATNGHFYVSYTTGDGGVFNQGVSHIARFTVSASDPNFTDPSTEVTVLTADQPQPDHDFDWIGFSPRAGDEGNLYICSGDGGNACDMGVGHALPNGNGQSTATLLGKILRIHIEDNGTYTIPANNPFAGQPPPIKQEIFCYGVRNPFRASFDPKTKDLLFGDVGEATREELDLQSHNNPGGGENYGWRFKEGLVQSPCSAPTPPPGLTDPILDYTHETTGVCVIGGYMYSGRAVRALKNLYVFGDCFGPDEFVGRVWTARIQRGVASDFTDITSQLFPTRQGGFALGALTSLGVDAKGEIYLVDEDLIGGTNVGSVYKIVRGR